MRSPSNRSTRRDLDQDVAVIGYACRFPGAVDAEEFWHNLAGGVSTTKEVPNSRWDPVLVDASLTDVQCKQAIRYGGFLDDVDMFDAAFFKISEERARFMDPQQRIILELAAQALNHAGYVHEEIAGTRTAALIAAGHGDYEYAFPHAARYTERWGNENPITGNKYGFVGNAPNMISGGISYHFNLNGPNYIVSSACSSSLVSVHLGCQSVLSGESDLALVGGIQLYLSPRGFIGSAQTGLLSPDGKCRTFSRRANGCVLSEGAGICVIKRLDHAIRDGDSIHAIIRSSTVNSDGRSMSLLVPNLHAQKMVVVEAIRKSGLASSSISYLEANGTASLLGDSIEFNASSKAFHETSSDKQYCAIGTVEPNVGHAVVASGMASLIKVLLSLQKKELPPTLICDDINPRINFEDSPFFPVSERMAWQPNGCSRCAGINAFGFGGTNCHIVVEEFVPDQFPEYECKRPPLPPICFNRKRFWIEDKACAAAPQPGAAIASAIESQERTTSNTKQNATAPTEQPLSMTDEQLANAIAKYLTKVLAQCMAISETDLSWQSSFVDLGMESSVVVEVLDRISRDTEWHLETSVFFDFQDIGELSRHLSVFHGDVFRDFLRMESTTDKTTATSHLNHLALESCTAREPESQTHEAYAIVGLDCCFPESPTPYAFWHHLMQGDNLISEIPEWRRHWSLESEDSLTASDMASVWGGFVNTIDRFDAKFFNLSPREAALMDPRQRLLLESVWKAIEDSGHRPADYAGRKVGVFIGVGSADYSLLHQSDAPPDAYSLTGCSLAIVPNRVSFYFNFRGPSESIDTACSSSLVAVHRAVRAIRNGECEMAIAGGVNTIISERSFDLTGKSGILARDGRCKTFDSRADGYVRSEGVGAVLIKPLTRALVDRDHIYGLIRGTSVNHGGRANSLTAPNPSAQVDLLVEAYSQAEVDPATVSYIEAHGTGTSLGDPIEIDSLKRAFQTLYKQQGQATPLRPHCGIGSVKTNVGHLETAAGIAGLIKILMAMRHESLPGLIHFEELNPQIRLEGSPFQLINQSQPWKPLVDDQTGLPVSRRAGISSFGFGGTNAHVILEDYVPAENLVANNLLDGESVFVFSAKNEERLHAYAELFNAWLGGIEHIWPNRPTDWLLQTAYTLQVGREPMPSRLAIVANSPDVLKRCLSQYLENVVDDLRVFVGNVSHNAETSYKPDLFGGSEGEAFLQVIVRDRKWSKIAQLWTAGIDFNWELLYGTNRPHRSPLPTYPFARDQHWLPMPAKKDRSAGLTPMPTTTSQTEQQRSETKSTKHHVELKKTIRAVLVDTLEMNQTDIKDDVAFSDMGVDSMGGIDLIDRLKGKLQVELSPAELLEHSTVTALAKHIRVQFGKTETALASSSNDSQPLADVSEPPQEQTNETTTQSPKTQPGLTNLPPTDPSTRNETEPIAIIGVAGRFPGAADIEKFWANLTDGKSTITEVPQSRWNWRHYGDFTASELHNEVCRWGGFIDDVEMFDADFFNISPREAKHMDPRQRIFLEEAWKALEAAGYTSDRLDGTKCSVLVGCQEGSYITTIPGETSSDIWRGNTNSILAARISYFLNLQGASLAIDTACSSSLAAVHLACESIRNGSSEMALAGGVSLALTPEFLVAFGNAGMLAADGKCKAFDACADGFVVGEGVGVIVLKALEAALRDGDRIEGLILGSQMNQDGRTNGITAPNGAAQTELECDVYERYAIHPESISYVETHGTGTQLGDPVEFQALHRAFRKFTDKKQYCAIGSAKTNVGHAQAAAGIVGLIKSLLCLRHHTLVPSLNFEKPNQQIDIVESPFYVNTALTDWQSTPGAPLRAAISSFGFSGTNCHVVLQEPPCVSQALDETVKPYYLIAISAKTDEALDRQIARLADWLLERRNPPRTCDVSYTLGVGRTHFEVRCALVVSDTKQLTGHLQSLQRGVAPNWHVRFNPQTNSNGNKQVTTLLEPDCLQRIQQLSASETEEYGQLLFRFAEAYVEGYACDWSALFSSEQCRLISLPTYSFSKRRHWVADEEKELPDVALQRDEPNKIVLKSIKPHEAKMQPGEQTKARTEDVEHSTPPSIQRQKHKSPIRSSRDLTSIKAIVKCEVARILHLQSDKIIEDLSFEQLRLDSVYGIELVNALNRKFQTSLQAADLYDFFSVVKLSNRIHDLTDGKTLANRGILQSVPVEEEPQEVGCPGSDHAAGIPISSATTAHIDSPRSDGIRNPHFTRKVLQTDALKAISPKPEAIAVIGMSAQFPGARNLDELWQLLMAGTSSISEVPPERWDVEQYWDPNPNVPNKTCCRWGGFLCDIDQFDANFFRLSSTEAECMDPQQRLFLEEAWKAVEDAGYVAKKLANMNCGVFVGVGQGDYGQRHQFLEEGLNACSLIGASNAILAARISYLMDLKGPNLALDTSCSSAMVATHQACQSIRSGECDIALAGGVCVLTTPMTHVAVSNAGMLSKEGKCKTFDASADGFVPSEGVGVLVLKALSKAIEDRDHIYGVIRGSGVNQDGTTNGITAPSAKSQARLLCQVYDSFGIDPQQITYLEAHGTGTPLGDPIEFRALNETFEKYTNRKQFCAIGSIKTNLGHTMSAAGIAGLIKALLCLKNRKLVPTLHFHKCNADIDFEDSPFYVNTKSLDWNINHQQKRLAAVSSFGFSGTNAHVVVEERDPPSVVPSKKKPRLFILSARSEAALKDYCRLLSDFLIAPTDSDDLPELLARELTAVLSEILAVAPDCIDVSESWQSLGLDVATLHRFVQRITETVELSVDSSLLALYSSVNSLADYLAREHFHSLLTRYGSTTSVQQVNPQPSAPLPNLDSIAFTLQVGREAMEERLAIVADNVHSLSEKLLEFCSDTGIAIVDDVYQGSVRADADSATSDVDTTTQQIPKIDEILDVSYRKEHLGQLAQLWVGGTEIDWDQMYGSATPYRTSLPTYPFQRQRCWLPEATAATQNSDEVPTQCSNQRPSPPMAATCADDSRMPGENSREERRQTIIRQLIDTFSRLSKLESTQITPVMEFDQLGIDSIMIHKLTSDLSREFGPLQPTLFFKYKRISDLAEYLLINAKQPNSQPENDGERILESSDKEVLINVSVGDWQHMYDPPKASEGIAIVGMSGQFPQAKNVQQFWANLATGKDCITEIPPQRWDYRRFQSAEIAGSSGGMYCRWGGFLDDADTFDASFFGISPHFARYMDPQERLFIQTAWSCLEDAGYTRAKLGNPKLGDRRASVGVFAGVTYNEYQLYGAEAWLRGEIAPLNSQTFSVANRVSYLFNLGGPSIVLDTACASSLNAVHLACESIRQGECDAAIAGGVNLSLHPGKYYTLCSSQFAASDGRCRSFGEGGDGYVPAEGVGAVLLKPLSQAMADGDLIYGVIRATAVNHDGKTNGYSVPNPVAQTELIKAALRKAQVDPSTITYLEAHGTGTALGDPIEVSALCDAFAENTSRRQYCAIGSLKSNIGHLEAAAGIAQLIKVLLQIHHKRIAPTLLHSDQPNSNIDFANTPFFLARELLPWSEDSNAVSTSSAPAPRRAGISSFGAGGVNVHLIVEEYATVLHDRPRPQSISQSVLVPISAKSEENLLCYVREICDAIKAHRDGDGNPLRLDDIAYTLQVGREAMPLRVAFVARSRDELLHQMDRYWETRREERQESISGVFDHSLAHPTFQISPTQDVEQESEGNSFVSSDTNVQGLAKRWAKGEEVDFDNLLLDESCRPHRVSLPTYPFSKERFWAFGPSQLCSQAPNGPCIVDATPAHSQAESPKSLVRRLQSEPESERTEIICQMIVEIAGEILGFQPPQLPNINVGLFKMGLESVQSMQMIDGVHKKFGVAFYPTVVFDYPTIADLARYLADQISSGDISLPTDGSEISSAVETESQPFEAPSKSQQTVLARPVWKEAKLTLPDPSKPPGKNLLVFLSGDSFVNRSCRCTETFEHDGWRLVIVKLGNAYQECSDNEFEINPQESSGYDSLVSTLASRDMLPHEVVHWWLPDMTIGAPRSIEELLDRSLFSMYFLVRALMKHSIKDEVAMAFVFETDEDSRILQPMALSGFAKSLQHENPKFSCQVIEMQRPVDYSDKAASWMFETLERELRCTRPRATEVRYENGKRFTRQLIELPSVAVADHGIGETPPTIREEGTYLITGGAGELGMIVAAHLARKARARLVLTGRSSLDEKTQGQLQQLQRSGSEAIYIQADVAVSADAARLVQSVKQRFGCIHGVIHAAGSIKDAFLIKKQVEDIRAVIAPKVLGTLNLDEATHSENLDFFMMFSSVSSVFGNIGQCDYAYANGFMDEFARWRERMRKRQQRHGNTISINWPLWQNGGMQADALTKQWLQNNLGQYSLETDAGLAAFDQVLCSQTEQVIVLRGDRQKLVDKMDIAPSNHTSPSTNDVQHSGTPPVAPQRYWHTATSCDSFPSEQSIAVVGMACRFPGGAHTPEAFWELLMSGHDAIDLPPSERWRVDDIYDPRPQIPGKVYVKEAGFLKEDVAEFDAQFFGISPREAVEMDPQQRLLLETCWEALERGNQNPFELKETRTGVFVGMQGSDYLMLPRDRPLENPYIATGTSPSVAAGRIAHFLGLRGPALSLDTACSSSLVSVHYACESLRRGECSSALAGGVSLMLSPLPMSNLCMLGALSKDGRCKTFDVSADGYGRGEGCGMVLLKRLSDAQRDNDPIVAIIAGSAINHDGASSGMTVPSGPAQQDLIRTALNSAGILPSDIGYLEAHGTGTVLGDNVELAAITEVFGDDTKRVNPMLIGAVKSNIGHLEAAAGIASLIKVILSLQHRQVPPNLHLDQLNPNVDLTKIPASVPTNPIAWPLTRRGRTAGISSFGFSGTNAHLIVTESVAPVKTVDLPASWRSSHVLSLSAKSSEALRSLAARYQTHLARNPDIGLEHLCYTAGSCRTHFKQRAAIVGGDLETIRRGLDQLQDSTQDSTSSFLVRSGSGIQATPTKIAFLIGGSPTDDGRLPDQLCQVFPVFRQHWERYEKELAESLESFGSNGLCLSGMPKDSSRQVLWRYAQHLCLTMSLTELYRQWGISPAAVFGERSGLLAAAHTAGIMSASIVARYLSSVSKSMDSNGAFLRVRANWETTRTILADSVPNVELCGICGDQEVVISTAPDCGERAIHLLNACNVDSTTVEQDSWWFPGSAGFNGQRVTEASLNAPRLRAVSGVSGQTVSNDDARCPLFWQEQITAPTHLERGIETLYQNGYRIFVEIGFGNQLTEQVQACLGNRHVHYLSIDSSAAADSLVQNVAQLYCLGADVNWRQFNSEFEQLRVDLPTYAFQRRRYWIQSQPLAATKELSRLAAGNSLSSTKREDIDSKALPLQGNRLISPHDGHQFEYVLSVETLPELRDNHHVLHVGYYQALLTNAIAAVYGTSQFTLSNVQFELALVIPEGIEKTVHLLLDQETSEDEVAFQFFSHESLSNSWLQHASGTVILQASSVFSETTQAVITQIQNECSRQVSGDEFYRQMSRRGFCFGASTQWVDHAWFRDFEALALLKPPSYHENKSGLSVHPGILDACVQLFGIALGAGREELSFITVEWKRFAMANSVGEMPKWCHFQLKQEVSDAELKTDLAIGSFCLLSSRGTALAVCDRAVVKLLSGCSDDLSDLPQTADIIPNATDMQARLRNCSEKEQMKLLTDSVRRAYSLASELPVEEVPIGTPLRDLGMDSLIGLRLKRILEDQAHLAVSMDTLIKGCSITEIANQMVASSNVSVDMDQGTLEYQQARSSSSESLLLHASNIDTRKWVRYSNKAESQDVACRLICLPHGGAGASVFRDWSSRLPSNIEVCGIQLPGREDRVDERPIKELPLLLDSLERVMADLADRPYSIYGHSMGALIGYALAQRLAKTCSLPPTHLFVSGFASPFHSPNPYLKQIKHQFAERGIQGVPQTDTVIEWLSNAVGQQADLCSLGFDSTPFSELLASTANQPEALRPFVATLLADLQIVESYSSEDATVLETPITAFHFEQDDRCQLNDMVAWQNVTSARFSLHTFAGNHYYLLTDEGQGELANVIGRAL